MNRTLQVAPVRKSVVVEATPVQAFEFFTAGIDRWWPKDHHVGKSPVVDSLIEPFVGGRWYSRHAGGEEITVGHVRTWRPGELLVVSWEISAHWKPDSRIAYASEVEVRFIAESATRTRVELEHRHFEKMEGDGGAQMRDAVDKGWPGILGLYAKELATGASQP